MEKAVFPYFLNCVKSKLGLTTAAAVPVFYRANFRECSLYVLLRSLWMELEVSNNFLLVKSIRGKFLMSKILK